MNELSLIQLMKSSVAEKNWEESRAHRGIHVNFIKVD